MIDGLFSASFPPLLLPFPFLSFHMPSLINRCELHTGDKGSLYWAPVMEGAARATLHYPPPPQCGQAESGRVSIRLMPAPGWVVSLR